MRGKQSEQPCTTKQWVSQMVPAQHLEELQRGEAGCGLSETYATAGFSGNEGTRFSDANTSSAVIWRRGSRQKKSTRGDCEHNGR